MREVIDGVYDLPVEHVRAFVVDDGDGTTLIDTGFERTGDELVATLREEFSGVDRVILTHDGGDHYGGLNAVMDSFAPELCAARLETTLLDAIDHEPDVLFEDGDVLDGGIEVVQVPGHSPAPSALLLQEKRALVSGDVLDGADRRGLPDGYLLPPPETFNHDHAAAERNLQKLQAYDFDAVLVFHGSHVLENARDKLDRYLDFKEHYRKQFG